MCTYSFSYIFFCTVNKVTWTSVPMTQIGTINFGQIATQSFVIPSVIPSSAKEVLVYVYVHEGWSHPRDQITHLKIYTEEGSSKYIKYTSIHAYNGDSWAYNSENMWFPMTSNRRVYVEMPKVTTGNVGGYIYVIGYR